MTTYYHVPADKIGLTLIGAEGNGYEWPDGSMILNYVSATSRNWDGDLPVLKLEEFGERRLMSMTSRNILMNLPSRCEIHSYEQLKEKLDI